uniref:cytochrome c oxidase assembly factor 7-like n=1 Tax=Callithrix jacchus TaxID=9483 RepID=UPI00159D2E20|nr:cytochrome c oxidase assembly factor 7-like [Callithrix jacchus]
MWSATTIATARRIWEGCYRLVDNLQGIQKNFDEAAKVLKFNCEDNQHSDSCYKLGAYYVTGKGGLTQDMKAAASCFLIACEKPGKKSLAACHNITRLAHDGWVNEDGQPDLGKARDYYTRVCDAGYASSYFNCSAMFLQGGTGFFKDMDMKCKYSMKVCDVGHFWACANASRMYKLGDGIENDEAKAEVLKI